MPLITAAARCNLVGLIVLLCASAGISHERPHADTLAIDSTDAPALGVIHFPTSATVPEAHAAFVRGMLLLHLFEYERARDAFALAQRLEPDFAMAYWGEAMTYNHPIWDQQDRDQALATLIRLGINAKARAAKAPAAVERDFLAAVDVLYGEGSKAERDLAYLRFMADMANRYPDDHEVRLFHALAYFGVHAGVRDIPDYLRAAAIAQDVFSANPQHPGAAHYLIHGVDDPVHAVLGLSAARALARLAPDAGHAQHMASHIFLELGMWDALIAANRAALEVVNRQLAQRGMPPRHTGHYNFWLLYGLLQTGQQRAANNLLEQAIADRRASSEPPPGALQLDADTSLTGSLVQMWARYLIETRDWNSDILNWPFELGDGSDPKLLVAFVRSMAGFRRGDIRIGQHWQQVFEHEQLQLQQRVAAQAETLPTDLQFLDRLDIQRLQLQAVAQMAAGRASDALAAAADASKRESHMASAFGPPLIDYPAAELHGDLLRESDQPALAVAAYRLQLNRSHGKRSVLRSLIAAANAAGDTQTVRWAEQHAQ